MHLAASGTTRKVRNNLSRGGEMEVREAIRTQPMRRFQIVAVITCLLIAMVDGYDILVIAFAAPFLSKAWSIGPVEIGYLISAGLFGAAVGSVLVSPLADRIGRRPHIIVCVALLALGLGASAFAQDVPQLIWARVFSGLWIGGVTSSLNVIASEYCSEKKRGVVMGLYAIGFPLGAAFGGALTNVLVDMWGWRGLFVFAALVSAGALILVLLELPESIEFLVERRPNNALDAYNKIAKKLNYPAARALPERDGGAEPTTAFQTVFRGEMAIRTALLWLGYGALTIAFFLANAWTPKLIAQASGDPAIGVRAGTLVLAGGVVGSLLFAALSWKIRPRLVTMVLMTAGAIVFWLFGASLESINLALVLAVAVGVCANGGITAFIAISPPMYATTARATGVGWMLGFGRAVSIPTPIVIGYMLGLGWKPTDLYTLSAGTLVFSALCVLALDLTYRGRKGAAAPIAGAAIIP
jgi:benzoate transport